MPRLPFLAALAACSFSAAPAADRGGTADAACPGGTTELSLPTGFCATVFVAGEGRVRHLVVAPNGDLYAATADRGILAAHDVDGDGRADTVAHFGPESGTGIALADGYLYFGADTAVYRWRWRAGELVPAGAPEIVVGGLPTGGHRAKPIVVRAGQLYVDLGSATNSCQEVDRTARSPGRSPCTELETRAGIWRFSAERTGQRPADGTRFATGLRNPMALAFEPVTGTLWMATHGRDQLGQNWGFSDSLNAELPAEEFGPVTQGADYGWPYCYYDPLQRAKVQAPEYGGDGRSVGPCASKTQPAIGFPGHWAPIGLTFYTGAAFPERYRGGAFLAFHGSWNRAPLPQAGYRVAFVPFRDGHPTGDYETFAAGTAAPIRPVGLAMGPDGALFIGADAQAKVWKVRSEAP